MGQHRFIRYCSLGTLLVGLLSSRGAMGVASASSRSPADTSNVCSENYSSESPGFVHTNHDDIVSGVITFTTVFQRGEQLFKTTFNECDGRGRPGATGSGMPTERPLGSAPDMIRTSAPEAFTCTICHNIPRTGGGGEFATEIFFGSQMMDPVAYLVDGTMGDERASPILFGVGAVELLGREITYDLADTRRNCLDRAISAGYPVSSTLVSHGVNYGVLWCNPQGGTNPTTLGGIDSDLVVKPFHQKGGVRSIREFTVNPLNHHHGIEAIERYGYDRTYRTDFDQDGVLTENEATIGDVDVMVVYQAFLAVPGQVMPDDGNEAARVNHGHDVFASVGCTNCHIEELQTRTSDFLEPYENNTPGTLRDQSKGFSYNLLTNGALPRFDPVTPGAQSGPMKVRLFSDLKRHVICDATYTHYCNELVQQGTAPMTAFMTTKLWGVGNTPPYGHRGDIATLTDAILFHGGEGLTARNNFANLSQTDRDDVIKFLKSLQVLPNGATRLVMTQSEVDALNRGNDTVLINGHLAQSSPGLSGLLAHGLPLGGSPLVFLAGMVAYPLLRRRQVRFALHVLVGTVVLSVVLSGVSLAATGQGKESASVPVPAAPDAPPLAKLEVYGKLEPAQGKVPLTVTLNNLSTGNANQFEWTFGDGSPSLTTTDLSQVSHTYNIAGTYAITLTAKNTQTGRVSTKVYPNLVYADSITPWFTDVTATSGAISNHAMAVFNTMPFGTGAGWADYDNDGWEDLYVSQNGYRSWLWHNNGDSTFTNMASEAGVENLMGVAGGVSWADYDNDGWEDLLVLNFDYQGVTGKQPRTKLYHNNHNGTFTDVAATAGLAADGWRRGMSATWGDYDNDGLLDLYIVNHTSLTSFGTPPPLGIQDQLYHQNVDHTFTNVTSLLNPITDTQGTAFSAVWVDFDNDGDQDLYVVNDFYIGMTTPGKNILWRNDGSDGRGGWRFTDVCSLPTQAACVNQYGMGLAVADFNFDGWQDLVVSNIRDSHILRGRPGMLFSDETYSPRVNVARGLFGDRASITWGEYAFDYNNDGPIDLLQVAGWANYGHNETFAQPDALLKGDGYGRFTDVSALSGLDDPNRGRGGAFADYDQDGQIDWFVTNFGEADRLFHNDYRSVTGNSARWLEIKLIGTESNRDAIGARVEVAVLGRTLNQFVLSGTGHGSSNSHILHVGLAQARRANITIHWPSGRTTNDTVLLTNRMVTYTEP